MGNLLAITPNFTYAHECNCTCIPQLILCIITIAIIYGFYHLIRHYIKTCFQRSAPPHVPPRAFVPAPAPRRSFPTTLSTFAVICIVLFIICLDFPEANPLPRSKAAKTFGTKHLMNAGKVKVNI